MLAAMTYRASAASEIVVVAFNGHVFGMKPETGHRIWSYDLPGNEVRLAFDEGMVFVATVMSVACLDGVTGVERWKHASASANPTLLVEAGRVFLGDGGKVTCLSALDGRVLWTDAFKGKGSSGVAIGVPGNIAQADVDR